MAFLPKAPVPCSAPALAAMRADASAGEPCEALRSGSHRKASDAAATPRRPLDLTRALALAMERHLGRVAVMVALDGDVLRSIVEKLCGG